jgi:hypothetical protein
VNNKILFNINLEGVREVVRKAIKNGCRTTDQRVICHTCCEGDTAAYTKCDFWTRGFTLNICPSFYKIDQDDRLMHELTHCGGSEDEVKELWKEGAILGRCLNWLCRSGLRPGPPGGGIIDYDPPQEGDF